MRKYVIFVDLDGTLLESSNKAHEETVEYLKSLKDIAHVCINSGRPYRSSKKFYDQLELDTPISNYNGAYVHNPTNPAFNPRMLTLSKDVYFDILKALDDDIEGSFAEISDVVYTHKDTTKYDAYMGDAEFHRDDIFNTLKKDAHSIVIIAKPGKSEHIIDYITLNTDFKCRHWGREYSYIIELFNDEVSKGSSCEYIVEQLGLSRSQTICFGDEQNDISMLQYVHIPVVMGNAHDDRIGDNIKYQTLKNTEGGIKVFLEDFFNHQDLSKYLKENK